jgi:uncharacterized protein (TIGR00162 family)
LEKIEVLIREKPSLKDPILVCGLPDSGLVAKLAIQRLLEATKASLMAEVYSAYFPPGTIIERDGTARLVRNEIYYAQLDHKDRHLLIYTGDIQPQDPPGAYELADRVLETAKSLGAREAVILAAFIRGQEVTEPRVYGAATDAALAQEYRAHGVAISDEGYITWMHGLLLGLSKLKGMRAICLSSETPGDRHDPAAASALLKVLGQALGINIGLEAGAEPTAPGPSEEGREPPLDETERTRYIR